MAIQHKSSIGTLEISEPVLHVDNASRRRSGHMTHAMVEYAPGRIMGFNSNCSGIRSSGHSAFGWIEYRYSEDGGKSWSTASEMPFSKEILLEGVYTISIEKAVYQDGVLTCFALRNTQYAEICCQPWDTSLVIRSFDLGKTWEKPYEFSPWKGRIYDAKAKDGVIYVLETCDPDFISEIREPRYRLFTSRDNGASFQLESVVDMESYKRGYGSLQFHQDGTLLVYACNLQDSCCLEVCKSMDNGKSWIRLPEIHLSHGLRNVQIAPLAGGYVMHGRAWKQEIPWGKGQVIYTSKDGIEWDDGIMLELEKSGCYYSNMLPLKDSDGKDYVLLQYSDLYAENWEDRSYAKSVNVMHRFLRVIS